MKVKLIMRFSCSADVKCMLVKLHKQRILCFLYHALWYNYVMYSNRMHTFQINVSIFKLMFHFSN